MNFRNFKTRVVFPITNQKFSSFVRCMIVLLHTWKSLFSKKFANVNVFLTAKKCKFSLFWTSHFCAFQDLKITFWTTFFKTRVVFSITNVKFSSFVQCIIVFLHTWKSLFLKKFANVNVFLTAKKCKFSKF